MPVASGDDVVVVGRRRNMRNHRSRRADAAATAAIGAAAKTTTTSATNRRSSSRFDRCAPPTTVLLLRVAAAVATAAALLLFELLPTTASGPVGFVSCASPFSSSSAAATGWASTTSSGRRRGSCRSYSTFSVSNGAAFVRQHGGGGGRCRSRRRRPNRQEQQQRRRNVVCLEASGRERGGSVPSTSTSTTTGSSSSDNSSSDVPWYPVPVDEDDIYGGIDDDALSELQKKSVQLAADLIRRRLSLLASHQQQLDVNGDDNDDDEKRSGSNFDDDDVPQKVKGRFMDLACDERGERALESLFSAVDVRDLISERSSPDDVRGAVMVLQSLCVMGMSVGLKGPPEQLKRLVSHLDSRNDPSLLLRDLEIWDSDSVRRLKYRLDRIPAMQLLSKLVRKRAPQGAFDLLVELGAWTKHEDLALLRSGFPLRFTEAELAVAGRIRNTSGTQRDPDGVLGIRRDMREMKVYTIDSASTSEIDDGLSLEVVRGDDGSAKESHRIWIHIADVDRWADDELSEIAKKRVTSLYLPRGTYPMFPPSVSTELMSLRANKDTYALSLGVELNEDGSIKKDSVVIAPSQIRVSYRLTYDDVDEMLEEGAGYSEEWQLGAMLDAAIRRRKFRIRNGSTEGLVANPIPYATVSVYPDKNSPDGIGISHSVQVSHNAGANRTTGAEDTSVAGSSSSLSNQAPVSSSYLLVTEMMILAGEAIGHWKRKCDVENDTKIESAAAATTSGSSLNTSFRKVPNQVRLPFRTQPKPDFKSRSRENRVMMDLLEYNVGKGYCHAWYARRFLQSVKVSEIPYPHSGLGLSSYVQWSSPIRRLTDFQVHVSVKRCLRRERINQLLKDSADLPAEICDRDLGFPPGTIKRGIFSNARNSGAHTIINVDDLDQDLAFLEGLGLVGAARTLQRQSQQYWMYEYIRRLSAKKPAPVFSAVVLGCIDADRKQHAIYLEELGLEHRYVYPGSGRLDPGTLLQLKVDSVSPRFGALSFVQVM